MLEGPGEPAPVLPPLDLEDAGLRVGKDPDPVPAPFAGAVGAPTSFRACHHSIPLGDGPHDLRDGKVAERRRLRQSWPGDALAFRGEVRTRTNRFRGEARSRRAGQPLTRFLESAPRLRGFGGARCVFDSQKPLAGGYPPDPARHPRAMSTGQEMSRFGGLPRKGCRAPGQDHRSDCAHGPPGHRQPLGHRERGYTRFRSSIIHREDAEFLCRKSETGGSEGARPPASLRRGRMECGPKE